MCHIFAWFAYCKHILAKVFFFLSFFFSILICILAVCDKWNWNMYQKAKGNAFDFLFVNSQKKNVCRVHCVCVFIVKRVEMWVKSGSTHKFDIIEMLQLNGFRVEWIGLVLYKLKPRRVFSIVRYWSCLKFSKM